MSPSKRSERGLATGDDARPAFAISVEELRGLIRAELAGMTARESDGPGLLDRRGLAVALACGVDTVDRLRREGCPELLIGDAPRFELDRVLSWLRARGRCS